MTTHVLWVTPYAIASAMTSVTSGVMHNEEELERFHKTFIWQVSPFCWCACWAFIPIYCWLFFLIACLGVCVCTLMFTCILLPSLWRSSYELCTCGSTGTQPQTPDSQTEPTELQTPGYWRSLDYSLKGKVHTHKHNLNMQEWFIKDMQTRVYAINQSLLTQEVLCVLFVLD